MKDTLTIHTVSKRMILSVSLFLIIGFGVTTASASKPFAFRISSIVEEGEPILFNLAGEVPVGASGPMSTPTKGRPFGSFETTIQPSSGFSDIVTALITAYLNDSAYVNSVDGIFDFPFGEIADNHAAFISLSPEDPIFGPDNEVVVVTAFGTIDPDESTWLFSGRGGTSTLLLIFELDIDALIAGTLATPPLCRKGVFVFDVGRK